MPTIKGLQHGTNNHKVSIIRKNIRKFRLKNKYFIFSTINGSLRSYDQNTKRERFVIDNGVIVSHYWVIEESWYPVYDDKTDEFLGYYKRGCWNCRDCLE